MTIEKARKTIDNLIKESAFGQTFLQRKEATDGPETLDVYSINTCLPILKILNNVN